MKESTKVQFSRFVEALLKEVHAPPIPGQQPTVTQEGTIKDMVDVMQEYDENMQLRIVLTIINSQLKEGKLNELYWLLRIKFIETQDY